MGLVSNSSARLGHIRLILNPIPSAFGGMVAFCIIVGDTIPHVLSALFPSLSDIPVLWLLTNRRAVIVLFVLGVSYPLSLYRDIAKVQATRLRIQRPDTDRWKLAKASTLALISMLLILVAIISQGFRVPSELRGHFGGSLLTLNQGVFQAIGVISFGKRLLPLIQPPGARWNEQWANSHIAFVCREYAQAMW